MKTVFWTLLITSVIFGLVFSVRGGKAIAADTSTAVINLSGNVPVLFSVTSRGYPGDMDLEPNVTVTNRLLGILHFQYNENVATITLTSSTASGLPENSSNVAYGFATAMTYSMTTNSCVTADATNALNMTAADIKSSTTYDISSATAKALTQGINEDCYLTATWTGTTTTGGGLALAGVYSENLTVTMTSD